MSVSARVSVHRKYIISPGWQAASDYQPPLWRPAPVRRVAVINAFAFIISPSGVFVFGAILYVSTTLSEDYFAKSSTNRQPCPTGNDPQRTSVTRQGRSWAPYKSRSSQKWPHLFLHRTLIISPVLRSMYRSDINIQPPSTKSKTHASARHCSQPRLSMRILSWLCHVGFAWRGHTRSCEVRYLIQNHIAALR